MKSFLSTILREQPDAGTGAGASADTAAAAATAEAAAAAAAQVAEAATAAAAEEAAKAAAKKPWYLDRISQESGKAQQAQARADAAERRAAEAEALATRLQANGDAAKPVADGQQPRATQDNDAAVLAKAEQLRFFEDTVEVKNRGLSEYGAAFTDTLNVLNAVGAASNDFVADVMAVNKAEAHKIFKQIADNPEKAVMLASMSSRQRIAELTRMTIAAQTKEPDPAAAEAAKAAAAAAATGVPAARVSKAPAPAPRIDPNA